MEPLSESEGSVGGHWKSKPKRQKSSIEDDLSQPWVCEETDPFTPRIRYFDFPKSRMPSHIKTYDGSEDPEDHLKIFQAAAKIEQRWGIHGRVYAEVQAGRDVKRAPECMKISGFMHEITNPELIKRLHDKILMSVDEMMRVTTTFLRCEVTASNRERKNSFPSWKQHEAAQKQNFKKGGFQNQQRPKRKQDRFTLLTKTPKEILALDKGKFKPPPPMTTPVEKRNASKFCELHGEVGYTTDECMHLKRQIREMLKAGKLSHLIKELKQSNGKDQEKAAKKGKTSGKDKLLAILMEDGTEGPMIIEAEMGDIWSTACMWTGAPLQKSCMKTASIDSAATLLVRIDKACPKDGYPLPEIDWKVESLCGYPFKCFLDAYKGYHQIKMAEEDEENTTFITSQRIFCYSKMSFGLKNTGATYQRLVDKAFQKQSGQNLEVYVDDLVIKRRTKQEIIRDIEETFKTLREINMKLNPKKCTFEMREGMFLGYKVNVDGLKVCPDKVEAVLSFPSHKCLKDVKRLNGKLASLNRFLSKSAKNSLPFFKTLKKCTKKSDFQWTVEAETTFKQMKTLIAELPMLTAPKEKEELIIFLTAAREAISVVLMTERDGKQMPIYFVSRALHRSRINTHQREKLILASEEHDIHYRPRTSVKGQILANFIIERPEDDPPDTPIEDKEELQDPWILFTDGSSCIDGSGVGLIITNPEGMEFTYALRFRFNATNNEAEYEALIAGLRIAEQMGVKNLQANVDSRLVANRVNGTYVAKEPGMIKYLEKVKNLASTFKEFSIKQVPRGENKKADALSKMTSTNFAHLSKQVFVEELKEKSIDEKEVLAVVEEEGRT
ncbi:reverse transcriptase domain-containing protein [Tanacetum coccineum]